MAQRAAGRGWKVARSQLPTRLRLNSRSDFRTEAGLLKTERICRISPHRMFAANARTVTEPSAAAYCEEAANLRLTKLSRKGRPSYQRSQARCRESTLRCRLCAPSLLLQRAASH